ETHEALLTDPDTGSLFTFTMLDNTVTQVTLPSTGQPGSGAPLDEAGFGAAAASPLEDVGIAVNANSTAKVIDLASGVVLQTIGGLGTSTMAQGVAVDPVTNEAVVINHEDGTVTIVSLGSTIDPLQITEASPAIVFGGPGAANTTLTIVGSGFVGTSEVLLDGTALPAGDVNVVSARKIIATVPGTMLDSPRRYIVQVRTGAAGGAVSNVTDLSVIQAIPVGLMPAGVAVDTERDAAIVTNSGDGTASIVSLTPVSTESPLSLGNIGAVGSPVLVGTTPEGVAVWSRQGLAVVANNGSNNASVVDMTGEQTPVTVDVCTSSGCSGPTGVAVNPDTGQALVTSTNPTSPVSTGSVSIFSLPATSSTASSSLNVDHDPVSAAVDPNLGYAAIATASQASSIDFINLTTLGTAGSINSSNSSASLENPSSIVFDPVNQVFLAANSLLNNVLIVDPTSFVATPVNVGIAPTSLDYNYQTSTLVTANSPSGTLSVLDYVCPPNAGAAPCEGPKVRTVLGLGGTQTSPLILGANAVAIDPKLNLAVLADPDNSRVLLVPLPH
ncbi:MAG TPA: hypothetical protein VMD78_08800, partial [Candidatus Baltobacteraceae bacterium]|nr:hypothetical protein [Candidatus Baltobacteraceae bacterium]